MSEFAMWDRLTESWWQQLSGNAIVGELTGRVLPTYPAQILGWSTFKAAYPADDVLSRETGFTRQYGQNPYVGYDDIDSSPFLYDGFANGRMRPMERVVGVAIGGLAVAYTLSALAGPRVANDEPGGQPVAILYAPGARSAVDHAEIADPRDVGQVGVFSTATSAVGS